MLRHSNLSNYQDIACWVVKFNNTILFTKMKKENNYLKWYSPPTHHDLQLDFNPTFYDINNQFFSYQ